MDTLQKQSREPRAAGINQTMFMRLMSSGVGTISGVIPEETIAPTVDDNDIRVVLSTRSFSPNQC